MQTLAGLPGLADKTLQAAVARMSKATVLGGAIVALQLAGNAFGTHVIEVRPHGWHQAAHHHAGLNDRFLCRALSTPAAAIRVTPEAHTHVIHNQQVQAKAERQFTGAFSPAAPGCCFSEEQAHKLLQGGTRAQMQAAAAALQLPQLRDLSVSRVQPRVITLHIGCSSGVPYMLAKSSVAMSTRLFS